MQQLTHVCHLYQGLAQDVADKHLERARVFLAPRVGEVGVILGVEEKLWSLKHTYMYQIY